MADSSLPPESTRSYAPDSATQDFSPPPSDVAAEIGTILTGRYRLLRPLGEGGMGTVYLAEQSEPVKRRVALKVIKAGMDSRAVLARFDAERQALALMDHPGIARVYDGGTTAHGQPFFVMELVAGLPITRFCDQQRLTPRARLELFVQVCRAVQHAHQKGIIHRDLKPSTAARVWDARTGLLLHELKQGAGSKSLSPDGVRIFIGGADRVRIWDARTGSELPAIPGEAGRQMPAELMRPAFSADGTQMATLMGGLRVWDTTARCACGMCKPGRNCLRSKATLTRSFGDCVCPGPQQDFQLRPRIGAARVGWKPVEKSC